MSHWWLCFFSKKAIYLAFLLLVKALVALLLNRRFATPKRRPRKQALKAVLQLTYWQFASAVHRLAGGRR